MLSHIKILNLIIFFQFVNLDLTHGINANSRYTINYKKNLIALSIILGLHMVFKISYYESHLGRCQK